MRKTKEQKTNNGITLIALVITIVVMLLLVAVTISMAMNGGLFGYAGRASGETKNAINEEQLLAEGKIKIDGIWYDSLEDYINRVDGIDGEIFSALYTENKKYTDVNGDTAIIPKGFSVGKSAGINTIEKGLVVQDAKGNQFVWIPVEDIATFYRKFWGNTTNDILWSSEPFEYGYVGEALEYDDMLRSVYKNKGFYIGRFEAGSTIPRTKYEEDGTTKRVNGTTEMVIKRDAYPYNFVGWVRRNNYISEHNRDGKGAFLLCKELYGAEEDEEKYGVKSILCYDVMWDAMLGFIEEERDVINSINWGNYSDNEWTVDRQTAKFSDDEGETWQKISDLDEKSLTNTGNILLTTGASDTFVAKNIYDLAGNVSELSMNGLNGSGGDGTTRGNACVTFERKL